MRTHHALVLSFVAATGCVQSDDEGELELGEIEAHVTGCGRATVLPAYIIADKQGNQVTNARLGIRSTTNSVCSRSGLLRVTPRGGTTRDIPISARNYQPNRVTEISQSISPSVAAPLNLTFCIDDPNGSGLPFCIGKDVN